MNKHKCSIELLHESGAVSRYSGGLCKKDAIALCKRLRNADDTIIFARVWDLTNIEKLVACGED